MASHPGIITDYATLANDPGMSRKTLSRYIYYLERGFVIQKCYNFSKNRLTGEKKMKRLHLSSTTLLFQLCEDPDTGRTVENLIINSSHARFFWRKGTSEVDYVLSEGDSIMPIESTYKDGIQKKEVKGLLKFLKEFSLDAGCVVTKDRAAEEGSTVSR